MAATEKKSETRFSANKYKSSKMRSLLVGHFRLPILSTEYFSTYVDDSKETCSKAGNLTWHHRNQRSCLVQKFSMDSAPEKEHIFSFHTNQRVNEQRLQGSDIIFKLRRRVRSK